jgi:hypothetical protein
MNNEDKLNKVNKDGEGRILLVSTLAKPMEIQMFESGFERFWKAYPSTPRKGAKKHCEEKWAKFQADPDWIKARAETEANGPLLTKVTNEILQPTSFSSVK